MERRGIQKKKKKKRLVVSRNWKKSECVKPSRPLQQSWQRTALPSTTEVAAETEVGKFLSVLEKTRKPLLVICLQGVRGGGVEDRAKKTGRLLAVVFHGLKQ